MKASRGRQKHEDNSNSNLSLSILHEQQPIASEESKPEEYTTINTGTPICNGSPSSNAGDGLKQEPDPKTLGGPLKYFLNKMVSPTAAVVAIASATEYNHSIPSNSVNLSLNPIKADEDIPNSHSSAPGSTLSIHPKPEPFADRNLFIKDPETEMQINIESDANFGAKYINQDVNSQNAAPDEEEREFKQPQLQSQSPLSDSKNPSVTIDWDSEENHQRRFWARVMDEKKIRQEEERKLEEQRRYLIQERYNIEEQKKALEAKLFEVEELIPSAKVLKDIGIGFDQAFVWIDCIKEVAQKERIDERTAAWKLALILRLYILPYQQGTLCKA